MRVWVGVVGATLRVTRVMALRARTHARGGGDEEASGDSNLKN